MDSTQRRMEILRTLERSEGCVSAAQFAERFGVTRQIIVSDIALLRAEGRRIAASRWGYQLEAAQSGLIESVVCRHSSEQVLDEFYAVVDNGGSVESVVVEHPIYGEISARLSIRSRYDAREFMRRLETQKAAQLSDLTGGLHVHTLRVPDRAAFERIISQLQALGILAEGEQ